jgi:hypothetical protein
LDLPHALKLIVYKVLHELGVRAILEHPHGQGDKGVAELLAGACGLGFS